MSILKKLVGFLFEEDEEISEEGELEEISLSEYRKEEKPRAPRYEEEQQEHIRVEDAHGKKTVKTTVQDELPPQEQKHFTNIEIAKEEPKKAAAQPKRSAQPQVREKQPRKEAAVKQEYEFTPVISPIFGATDSDNKTVKKASSTVKSSSTVTKASKKNPLATIISPIYGASELEEFEEEAKEQQKQDEQPKVDIATINENMMEPEPVEEEEMENVPLSDLLAKEEVSDTGEDLLQFSLFGDDEVVRTDIKEDSYTIKE